MSKARAAMVFRNFGKIARRHGEPHEVHGSILAVYHRDPDGWHLRMVQPSVPRAGGQLGRTPSFAASVTAIRSCPEALDP